MNLNQQQSAALRKFAPQIESFSRKAMLWIYILLIPIFLAAYALYVQCCMGIVYRKFYFFHWH